ncbi:MAG: DUF3465 domain-containing protein [Acidobacteriota bacterium]
MIRTVCIFALFHNFFTACSASSNQNDRIATAFEHRERDVQVEGEGVVSGILADDRSGSPHQRFVVRLASGQTVLIEHNIELAPRIEDLREGDPVSFSGEYIWNEKGGLIHWTHHDPAQKHQEGWIKHKGRTYQ